MSFELPSGFGFVAAAVFSSWFVHHGYMAQGVMSARKKYGVKYPTLYATEADCPDAKARQAFNCTQRAHQNSLENLPTFYALLLTAGLKYPITSAVAGYLYLVGRILYFNGYSSGEPNSRHKGAVLYLGTLTLLGCVGRIAFEGIKAWVQSA